MAAAEPTQLGWCIEVALAKKTNEYGETWVEQGFKPAWLPAFLRPEGLLHPIHE